VTLTADTPRSQPRHVLGSVLHTVAGVWRRGAHRGRDAAISPQDALVRALCHDMCSPLASLHALLHHLEEPQGGTDRNSELLDLARAQTEHLSSMLRTAIATGGAVEVRGARRPRLVDVVASAVAASGLPSTQLETSLVDDAAEVLVADARVQRILTNLLENAHRHGQGALVRLRGALDGGWVELRLSQAGVPDRVVGHLRTDAPPLDLTGLGLWSVRRQTTELGGHLTWRRGPDGEFTFVVRLPDR
jgi:K+-sensing histidine kinase KdpD